MKKLFLCLSVAALIFTACSDDDDDNGGNVFEGNQLQGDFTEDVSLDASVEYSLVSTVRVKSGATLTIPAGTVIKAQGGSTAFFQYILVEQGGKIMAEGTAQKPIRLTSSVSSPAAGDWGGLIINGYAPISGASAGTTAATEIENNKSYGGTNANDNSGVLRYVTIEYAGANQTQEIEHNGLTLNAVGSGTVIENIYVLSSADDGIEFFGGSVNVTNLLVVNSDDDMFDCTQGWTGTLKNAYGIWLPGFTSTETDPRGVEADGNFDGNGPTHVGQSDFTMQDITIVNNSTYTMNDVIKIRRGAKATITNALAVNGTTGDGIDLTDGRGDANSATSINLTITNVTYASGGVAIRQPSTPISTVTVGSGNNGATTSVFNWTGFSFPSL
ncbi:MAG: hypothetical protein AB2L24_10310 [Mangrovibacterium sp.]